MRNKNLAFAFVLLSGMLLGSIITVKFIEAFPTGIALVGNTGIL